MTYLIDTSVCVAVMRRDAKAVARLAAVSPRDVAASVVTRVELLVGADVSAAPARNRRAALALLDAWTLFGIDEACVETIVQVEVGLRQRGSRVGDFDLLIAATALAHDLTLVTRDRDFARVPGLRVEDWTA